MVEPYVDCSFYSEYGPYATTTFSEDGTLYVAFVASEVLNVARLDTPRHVFLARSEDGGRTFETAFVFRGEEAEASGDVPTDSVNKGAMLAVDPNDASRVYVGWRQGNHRSETEKVSSVVAASSDGGRTFGQPVDLSDERGGDYPALAVDGEGTVHAVYWTRTFSSVPLEEDPVRPIQYVRSTDRGQRWTSPVAADPGNQTSSRPPMLAADPESDALYLVWYANQQAMNGAEDFEGFHDIMFRRSLDSGATWDERMVLNDDQGNVNQFEPSLAIAPNGRLDVAWYDFRNSPVLPTPTNGQGSENGFSDVYYTFSDDEGSSFAPNVRITDRSIDRSIGVWSNEINSKFNIGLASTADSVYFAWQDSRNGKPETQAEDVYFASLSHDGASERSGSASVWLIAGSTFLLGMAMAAALLLVLVPRMSRTGARAS